MKQNTERIKIMNKENENKKTIFTLKPPHRKPKNSQKPKETVNPSVNKQKGN